MLGVTLTDLEIAVFGPDPDPDEIAACRYWTAWAQELLFPPEPHVVPPRKPRGASRFKRSETARIIKGVVDAGFSPCGVEADHASGTMKVLFGKSDTRLDDTPQQIIRNL
jgi:hypothetical protein